MLKYLKNVVTLQLDVKACNGCGVCVLVCPHAVFDIKDRKAIIIDRDACIECGACAINCPVNAIQVRTGAGCAAGVLLGAIGMDSCCSGTCGASPAGGESDQSSCCGSKIEDKEINNGTSRTISATNKQKEMTTFIIYESAMCCSSGVCGSDPDKSLIALQEALVALKGMGAKVERYSITGNPKKFRENPEIIKLMQEHQIKALPITTCDGKVIKTGSYPSIGEFKKYIEDNDIESLPSMEGRNGGEACCSGREAISNEGCCAGQNSCDISCGPSYKNNPGINTRGKCC